MTTKRQPTCWIIAGPNGAGKTTFALDYLPKVAGCRVFVNADLIVAGMSPLSPAADPERRLPDGPWREPRRSRGEPSG